MSRSTRRTTALTLSALLIGTGAMLALPTVAWAAIELPPGVTAINNGTLADPEYVVSIDCSLVPEIGSFDYDLLRDNVYLPIAKDDVVTVNLVNCESMWVWENDEDETAVDAQFTFLDGPQAGLPLVAGVDWNGGDSVVITGSSLELGPNVDIGFRSVPELGSIFGVRTPLAVDVADPRGLLIDELSLLIPADADADLVVSDDPQYWDDDDEPLLGGLDDCGIEPGNHFFDSIEFTVERTGTYTFRLSDLDPASNDLLWSEPARYLEDPFLALYSDFDPSDAHLGVVACDDDSDLADTDYYLTSSGTMMSDRYPQFTVELQPGTYTLVLTSYNPESEFLESSNPAALPYEPGQETPEKGELLAVALGDDESGTVEVWFEAADLAATGLTPAATWMLSVALVLLTLGGLALTRSTTAASPDRGRMR